MTDAGLLCERCGRSFSNKRGLSAHLRYHDPEQRKKTSQAMLGHKVSDETRLKISRFLSETNQKTDTINRRSEAMKKRWRDPEQRKRLIDSRT